MVERINDSLRFFDTKSPTFDAKKSVAIPSADTLSHCLSPNIHFITKRRPELEAPKECNYSKAIEEACSALEEVDEPEYNIINPENEETVSKRPRESQKPQKEKTDLGQLQIKLEKQKTEVTPAEKGNTQPQKNVEKMMLQFFKLHADLEGSFGATLGRELELQHGQQTHLRETKFNLTGDIQERKKTSEFLGWVNLGATCTLIASALALYFSAGPAMLLKFGFSAAGITQALATASKAIIDHNSSLKQGDLFKVNSQRKTLHQLIDEKTQTLTDTAKQLLDIVKMMREIVDKQKEVTRIIFS